MLQQLLLMRSFAGNVPTGRTVTETAGPEKLTVLLIDDNDEFRNYLKNNLSAGYKLSKHPTARRAGRKPWLPIPRSSSAILICPEWMELHFAGNCSLIKGLTYPGDIAHCLNGDDNQLKGLETGASDI